MFGINFRIPDALGASPSEDGIERSCPTILLADIKSAQRGAIRPFLGSESVFGGGCRVALDEPAILQEVDLLFGDNDDQFFHRKC